MISIIKCVQFSLLYMCSNLFVSSQNQQCCPWRKFVKIKQSAFGLIWQRVKQQTINRGMHTIVAYHYNHHLNNICKNLFLIYTQTPRTGLKQKHLLANIHKVRKGIDYHSAHVVKLRTVSQQNPTQLRAPSNTNNKTTDMISIHVKTSNLFWHRLYSHHHVMLL